MQKGEAMDRKQIIEILEKKGFQAHVENHILMISYFGSEMPLKEVKAILQENGYMASFGLIRSKSMTQYQPEPENIAKAV
ncbi:MAG: hypothetical protein IJT05_09735 [Lachnospiraceae bacterium]|nr:hypothetical protein [Lachnospiraceae bacterium]